MSDTLITFRTASGGRRRIRIQRPAIFAVFARAGPGTAGTTMGKGKFKAKPGYGWITTHTGRHLYVKLNNPDEAGGPHASKFTGQKVGKAEHVHADAQEKAIAKAVGGKQLEDNEPLDVRIPKAGGKGEHAVEVKSLLKGRKQAISVHDDALLRKVEYAAKNPDTTFHTVVVDHRDRYEDGAHAEGYSGHDLYYRRGSGRYTLGTMHPVKDEVELKRLIDTPDADLPAKARGSLPTGDAVAKLRVSAEKAHASRLAKDRARKARLRQAGQPAAGAVT